MVEAELGLRTLFEISPPAYAELEGFAAGNRVARFLSVVKHRGSAMSDEIAEYRVGEHGIVFSQPGA